MITKLFLEWTQNQRCLTSYFNIDLRFISWCVSTWKYGYHFNSDIKILIFQASRYESKTLFQSWIWSINQHWQIDVESTWYHVDQCRDLNSTYINFESTLSVCWDMTAASKNVYFDVLDDIADKYNNTFHRTIKISLSDSNKIRTHIHFVRKRTLNHSAKLVK